MLIHRVQEINKCKIVIKEKDKRVRVWKKLDRGMKKEENNIWNTERKI